MNYTFEKLLRTGLLLALVTVCVRAAAAQWVKTETGINASWNAVSFPSRATGFAIVNNGAIWGTRDSGRTWKEQRPYSCYMSSLCFLSDSVGWAAGGNFESGILLHTTDGGRTWTSLPVGMSQISAIHFISPSTGWATCHYNPGHGIFKTTDSGKTWERQAREDDYVRSVFFSSPKVGWIAGDNGQIYTTKNGGRDWAARYDNRRLIHFKSVFAVSDRIAWVVGAYKYGACFKTTDGGETWEEQELPTPVHLSCVRFISKDTGWIVGDWGTILHTTDGGRNWELMRSGTKADLHSVSFPDSGYGIAVGEKGVLMRYTKER